MHVAASLAGRHHTCITVNDCLTIYSHTPQVDPVIRAAMDVDLDGAVVIFDEGHNIEDTAR